jgi:hypothetical protein
VSRLDTGMTSFFNAQAYVLQMVTPIRTPVKEPGTFTTIILSISSGFNDDSVKTLFICDNAYLECSLV